MRLSTILANRTRLNAALRFRLNQNATRPVPVYGPNLAGLRV